MARLPRSKSSAARRAQLTLLLAFALAAAWIFAGTPFMASQLDAAWYYAAAHYLQTGEYLYAPDFPSFHGPYSFYPALGFPALILLAKAAAALLHSTWPEVLRWSQFLAYLLTALATWRTGALLRHPLIGWLAALATLLYYPLFRFATFCMTETFSAALIALALWWTLLALRARKPRFAIAAMLLFGEATLLRPTLLLAALPLVALTLTLLWRRRQRRAALAAACCLALLPLAQVACNGLFFDGWHFRKGSGFNLWNRVVYTDHLLPPDMPARITRLGVPPASPLTGMRALAWWEAAGRLSQAGVPRDAVETFCTDVALDGVRRHPLAYLAGTLSMTAQTLTADTYVNIDNAPWQPTPAKLVAGLGDYDPSPFWQTMARDLVAEHTRFADARTPAYQAVGEWAKYFTLAQRWGLDYWTGILFLAAAAAWTLRAAWRRRRRDLLRLAVIALPLLLVVASCLAERFVPRYKLPGMPLIFLIDGIFLIESARLARRFARRRLRRLTPNS
jgi:hypothetical protein